MHVRRAVAAAATASVTALGAGVATTAPADASLPAPPVYHLVGTSTGAITGMPSSAHAGRVTFSLTSHGRDGSALAIFKLRGTYTIAKLVHDFGIVSNEGPPNPGTPAAMRRINAGINAFGGPSPAFGGTAASTFTLYRGTYYWFNPNAPKATAASFHRLRVYGEPLLRAFPSTAGTIRAVNIRGNMRWSAPATLPHRGRILFRNTTDELHFLYFQQVKPGTTYKQIQDVANAFEHGQNPASVPFLSATTGTDILSPGNQVILSYNLPAGTYDLECFIPDDVTGMPHMFMGMHRIVVLK